MNRRNFLKQGALSTAGLALANGLPLPAWAGSEPLKLTILHTNDIHSRIDPFPADSRSHAGMGGLSRIASLVRQVREREPNVLLLDVGDIFQGTPYFNFFGGELEFKIMSQMGYDASTLGNHDFDNGLAGLEKQLPHARFPFLCANYDFSRTRLRDRFAPYQVFEKQGIRVGVFGIGIELAGLVSPQNFEQTQYLDPVGIAREMVSTLRGAEKCDMVVCLSHLGYKYAEEKIDDEKLARQVPGIDLILGGHTHTFLTTPAVVPGPDGHQTLINQVGWAGLFLGRVDFTFDRRSRVLQKSTASLLPVRGAGLS